MYGDKHLKKGQELFSKYGVYAVAVGAMSPIPYSAVCWTAGIYRMSYFKFILASIITRLPRFFLMGLIGYFF
ncbi:VTT domain-containing protein [Candidatus Woesearchaeota archaeon]|nr:VTT domain-containing protein [Candidatus Woesearchaeota archaeon]